METLTSEEFAIIDAAFDSLIRLLRDQDALSDMDLRTIKLLKIKIVCLNTEVGKIK